MTRSFLKLERILITPPCGRKFHFQPKLGLISISMPVGPITSYEGGLISIPPSTFWFRLGSVSARIEAASLSATCALEFYGETACNDDQ